MLTNKYIQMALSLAIVLSSTAATFDWTQFLSSEQAGAITGVLGIIKFALNTLAPAAGAKVTSTGGSIITHTST